MMKPFFVNIKLWLLLWVLLPQFSLAALHSACDSVACERAVDYYYLQALSLMEQEKYDAAFDMLEHCRSLSPSSSAVLFELVNMHQYLGQKEKALAMLKKIVNDNPRNYQFWLALVQYYDTEGNRDAALEVYEDMALAFPDKSDVFMALSARYAEMAEYDKAVDALERYEVIDGRSEFVSMQKYRLYVVLQRRDDALAELEILSRENPDDLYYRSIEADTYYLFNEKEKALAIYQDILEQEPDNVMAQISLVNHYKQEKNNALYVQNVEALLRNEKYTGKDRVSMISDYISYREQTDSAGCYEYVTAFLDGLMELPFGVLDAATIYSLYLSYSNKGEKEQLPILNKILSLEPDNRAARMQKLEYAIERNSYPEIIAECDTAIMYHPDMLELYYFRGLSCFFLGHKEEAVETYRQGVEKCAPETSSNFISDVYAAMGDIYHDMGKNDEAMQAYEASLSYNSTNIVVLNNYAYYLALENRDLDRALEMSYHTLKVEPDEAMYIDTYAWILFLLERYDEAKEYADRLTSIEGEKSAVELHHCGDIYSKCGDMEKALECWIKARDMGDDSKVLKKKIKKKKYIPDGKKK